MRLGISQEYETSRSFIFIGMLALKALAKNKQQVTMESVS